MAKNPNILFFFPDEWHPDWLGCNPELPLKTPNIDWLMGLFIDEVKERNELNNTIIVFSSDHGEMLGEHGKWGKSTWYEASTRIPLVISGPGIKKNTQTDALVVLHDITATFLDYAELPALPDMDGISLIDILEKRKSSHREYIISALETGKSRWDMIYNGEYKYVKKENNEFLYNLKEDPGEKTNLIMSQKKIAESLKNKLSN